MVMTTHLDQLYYVGIGEFELAFEIRLFFCPCTPGGWKWRAIAEDKMTGWFHGDVPAPTVAEALEQAVKHLTDFFG